MIADNAEVAPSAVVPDSVKIWGFAQVRERAQLGENVIVGRGAYVGIGVGVGSFSKIQNFALVYEPAQIGKGVFIGPAAVLTNDRNPRAVNSDWTQKLSGDWNKSGVVVGDGASIGARAVCVGPIVIGAWAMVAAGAVVTHDVADYALVAGVPARQIGWVGPEGRRLRPDPFKAHVLSCPSTGDQFVEIGENLVARSP